MKTKLFYIIAWFSIISGFALIGLLFFWAVWPYEVLTFGPENGKLLSSTVKSGDYLDMQQDFCKYKNIISEIDRQFINSIVYQLPKSFNNRPLGCHKRIEQIYIPKAIPPGTYYISTTITFQVNPIRHIQLNVKTAQFEIVR